MRDTRAIRRRGFTLTELIVSIGVLALMLTLAGEVMSLTVRSTGQAKALTDVNQQLRAFEQTLREDLKYAQPGNSLILIQGNPVNAYWTQQGRDADNDGDPSNGYPHPRSLEREDAGGNLIPPRADILMIFSARKGQSYVNPAVTSDVQQVVYGHATLGEYEVDPAYGGYQFRPGPQAFPTVGPGPTVDPTALSLAPARLWHLARRSTLLMPGANTGWAGSLTAPTILNGTADIVGDHPYDTSVLIPSPDPVTGAFPWYLPPIFNDEACPFMRSQLDETPPAPLANSLGHYFMPRTASFKVEWALDPRSQFVGGRLDGENQIYWFDPGDLPDPTDLNSAEPLSALTAAITEAEDAGEVERAGRLGELLDADLGGHALIEYDAAGNPTLPPAGGGNELYSLQDRFWDHPTWLDQWFSDGRPNLAIFTGSRRLPPPDVGGTELGALVPEDVFPAALRITIDVYDEVGRLERPIRHVMVFPVGR